jgi:hypothetical protein
MWMPSVRTLRVVMFTLALFVASTVPTAQVRNDPHQTATTSRAQAERILDMYFDGMSSHDFSHLPMTPDAEFRGSLHPEPVRGESALREFLIAVSNGARTVTPKWRVIDGDRACVHYEYQMNAGAVVPVVACFRFDAGRIAEERAFFDPRPFVKQSPSGNDGNRPK